MSSASRGVERVYVARAVDFKSGARFLVKTGTGRNIAVYNYRGEYYALDNACYHHGGALLKGDIEMLGGHPCVKCPLHSYPIAVDTGESFYQGISVQDGRTVQQLKSKGAKQRPYRVVDEGGEVYVHYECHGHYESDSYATVAVANREQPFQVRGGGGGEAGPKLHSSVGQMQGRSGQFLSRSSNPFTRPGALGAFGGRNSSGGGPLQGVPRDGDGANSVLAKCINSLPVSIDGGTRMFVFEKTMGNYARRIDVGQWMTLELPIPLGTAAVGTENSSSWGGDSSHPNGGDDDGLPPLASIERMKRTWTLTTIRGEHEGWFSVTVRRVPRPLGGRGGSTWLHEKGLHVPLHIRDSGGTFTIHHIRERLNGKNGNLLLLSAGVGVTPMYASINRYVNDQFTTISGPPLHMLHLHSEGSLKEVPFLGSFSLWHNSFPSHLRYENPVSYQFKLFLTAALSTDSVGAGDVGGDASLAAQGHNDDDATLFAALSNSNENAPSGQQRHLFGEAGFPPSVVAEPLQLDRAIGSLYKWADTTDQTAGLPNLSRQQRITTGIHLRRAIEYFSPTGGGGPTHFRQRALAPSGEEQQQQQPEEVPGCKNLLVMVCGPPAFMDDMSNGLCQLGVPLNNIFTEAFDF